MVTCGKILLVVIHIVCLFIAWCLYLSPNVYVYIYTWLQIRERDMREDTALHIYHSQQIFCNLCLNSFICYYIQNETFFSKKNHIKFLVKEQCLYIHGRYVLCLSCNAIYTLTHTHVQYFLCCYTARCILLLLFGFTATNKLSVFVIAGYYWYILW